MKPELILQPIRCAEGFTAWRLPVGKLPLAADERPRLARSVLDILKAVHAAERWSPRLWLDTRRLHEDGGSKLFGANARAWQPDMGFCFDPMEPPPRKLTIDDLLNMEWGTDVKIHDRTAIYVAAEAQTQNAYAATAGRGLAVLMMFAGDAAAAADRYNRHTKKALQSAMAAGQFQGFPFYLPLLTAAGVERATASQLELWLDDVMLYIREDESNGDVVLVSRSTLATTLPQAGWRRAGQGDEQALTMWQRDGHDDER